MRNKLKMSSTVLPLLFLTIPEDIKIIIIVVLSVIVAILLIYLIYLILKGQKKQPITKEQKEELRSQENTVHEVKIEIKKEPVEVKKEEVPIQKTETKQVLVVDEKPKVVIPPVTDLEDDGLYIRYNYSFVARLHQAPKESQERFSTLKNHILSYEEVTIRDSWRNERYMHKKDPIAKVWIHGNVIDLYINLDPNKIDKEKYSIVDMSDKKMHDSTPVLFKIVGNRTLDQAIELLDMRLANLKKKENFTKTDYTVPYIDKKTLLESKLIKINKA
ncbi:hypothetical protein BN85406550 [Alteracholeplasma palmae J233]|uniref:Uncharacterized protein n=1 Tax=Alteracholeplasma palmae (strain ATCC 49389 / J233) TaxID=1318466 RepID=U4KKP7_ALTPJ|nr:hypothetical protein [Alteracholeplasma palmae]CCV64232.1 hypothetical protein BN85406550 [Alteracholeplasma palmae J233]